MTRTPRLLVSALSLVLVFVGATAKATTYVPVSDEALVERAVVIGTFEVLSSELAPTAAVMTDYHVRLETLLKGELRGATAVVRVPGGRTPTGGLYFSGMPTFRTGERDALLFLKPRADGTWGIAHVLMGAFHQLDGARGDLLVRPHLEEARALDSRGRDLTTAESRERDRPRFLRWIEGRVAGRKPSADYWVAIDRAALAPRFTLFRDKDDGLPMRWFNFDGGGSVTWYSADPGPPGYADQGQAAVQNGLRAWSDLSQTPIELTYAGLGAIDQGFEDSDGINVVLFEDPHGFIDEPFDCSQGGVVAVGGPYYTSQVFGFKGQSYHPIIEGAVITNADLSCFLAGNTTRLSEVIGHEIGHTLGLRHSCGDDDTPACTTFALDDALMRATTHDDNRGARLGTDDMAAGRLLYSPGGGTGGTPKAPNQLSAQLAVDDVTLHWNDRSNNEMGFRLYRRLGGAAFSQIAQTGAGVTAFSDMNLGSGTWSYEVRAFNNSGESAASNRVTVVVQTGPPGSIVFADSTFYGTEDEGSAEVELHRMGGNSGPLSVRLRTSDLSAGAPLDYATRDLVVTWENLDASPKVVAISIVDDFSAEASELIEVLLETVPAGGQLNGTPLGAAAAVIVDDDSSPGCAPADRHLCLLGGRFKVEVEWRNQRNGQRGFGHALAGSDQSGYFWFFQQENVELIVKALDGRSITGAHWLFYGALSDVEYWVTVTDTATGVVQLYRNAPGDICGVGDTSAFPQIAAPVRSPSVAAAPQRSVESRGLRALGGLGFESEEALVSREVCVPGPQVLCLLGGRFKVEVNWHNHRNGSTGVGTAIPYSDQSGFFWFFDAANIELVVKALDGQSLNDSFWFFYGALSDVEYTIKVTDTARDLVHNYNNAGGNICGVGDINAFPED